MKDKSGTKKIENRKLALQSVHKPATIQSREARKPKKANLKPIQTKSESFRSRSLRFVFVLYFIFFKSLILHKTFSDGILDFVTNPTYQRKEDSTVLRDSI